MTASTSMRCSTPASRAAVRSSARKGGPEGRADARTSRHALLTVANEIGARVALIGERHQQPAAVASATSPPGPIPRHTSTSTSRTGSGTPSTPRSVSPCAPLTDLTPCRESHRMRVVVSGSVKYETPCPAAARSQPVVLGSTRPIPPMSQGISQPTASTTHTDAQWWCGATSLVPGRDRATVGITAGHP